MKELKLDFKEKMCMGIWLMNFIRSASLYSIRPRLHETGMKSIRDDLVSGIVLFIIDVYMRPGWKMLRPL